MSPRNATFRPRGPKAQRVAGGTLRADAGHPRRPEQAGAASNWRHHRALGARFAVPAERAALAAALCVIAGLLVPPTVAAQPTDSAETESTEAPPPASDSVPADSAPDADASDTEDAPESTASEAAAASETPAREPDDDAGPEGEPGSEATKDSSASADPEADATQAAPSSTPDEQRSPTQPPQIDMPRDMESPASQADTGDQELSVEQWEDDWQLLEPQQRALVELDGYFRLRAMALQKLRFGTGVALEPDPIGPRYPAASDGEANFTGANMRFRLRPTINITDQVQIVSTVDLLDNLVLGSTPRVPPTAGLAPVNILTTDQQAPEETASVLTNSVVITSAFGRVTALNEQLAIRFGRMRDHWGLGMLANDGSCLDCDFETVVDRISLTLDFADHLFTPMYTWSSSGPLARPFGNFTEQAIDAVTWDDVHEYGLRVQRVDSEREIEERLVDGETVLNYGGWVNWRRQFRGLDEGYWARAEDDPLAAVEDGTDNFTRRDAEVVLGDLYVELFQGQFHMGAEAAFLYGLFKDRFQTSDGPVRETDMLQFGATLELDYDFAGQYDGLSLGFNSGAASGDPAPGFGALDATDTQRGPDGTPQGDTVINNFQFAPAYHVDLLLFRRIIGTVTDAWYVRPSVSYSFDNDISGTFAAVYSQALNPESTPGDAAPLGVELDAELAYGLGDALEEDGFKASLVGGVLWPLGGMRNLSLPEGEQSGEIAWTVQGRLYLTF